MEEIQKKAERFDQLVSVPGWEEILEFAASRVNDAIILASTTEDSRDVIRWNAKRSLLDDILAEVNDTRKERDKIKEHYAGSTR